MLPLHLSGSPPWEPLRHRFNAPSFSPFPPPSGASGSPCQRTFVLKNACLRFWCPPGTLPFSTLATKFQCFSIRELPPGHACDWQATVPRVSVGPSCGMSKLAVCPHLDRNVVTGVCPSPFRAFGLSAFQRSFLETVFFHLHPTGLPVVNCSRNLYRLTFFEVYGPVLLSFYPCPPPCFFEGFGKSFSRFQFSPRVLPL